MPFALLLGVCLGLALHQRVWFERLWRPFGHPLAGLASLAAVVVSVAAGADDHLVVIALAGLVTATVITEHHPLAVITRFRALVVIGTVSYGIYLFHSLCIAGVERLLGLHPDPVPVFAAALILSIGCAKLSFHHFERPFLRLQDRHRSPVTPSPGRRSPWAPADDPADNRRNLGRSGRGTPLAEGHGETPHSGGGSDGPGRCARRARDLVLGRAPHPHRRGAAIGGHTR